MPAENPYNPDMSGINAMGRWLYGPWFFPPTPICGSTPDAVPPYCIKYRTGAEPLLRSRLRSKPRSVFCQPPEMPGTPNPSWGAEAFLDTMVVNGTAYPTVTVQPKPYRFRILNAAHDRFLNLQLYVADAAQTNPACPTCAANTEVAMVPRHASCTDGHTNCSCAAACDPGFPELADGRQGRRSA